MTVTGAVGGGTNVLLGRLAGQVGTPLGFAADAVLFFGDPLLGTLPGGFLGLAPELLDQGVDPLLGLTAHLLGALHDAAVGIGLALGDALAGQ